MIKSKEDYKFYLEADKIALGKERKRPSLIGDDIWKFERLLRKVEYVTNCKTGIFWKLYLFYLRYRFYKLSMKLGYCIPANVFGPGLAITFFGPILVNPQCRVGADCRISHCVTIGSNRSSGPPKIGNHVFIGPGSTIIGAVEIADGIAIGANSFVNKSFKQKGITIAGTPAKKILDTGSETLTQEATKILKKLNLACS
jgi:serine O-acetyltransferase